MIITWSELAARDLENHFDYLAARSPGAALAMEEAVMRAIERLADFPYMGRPGTREGTRELVVSRYPYVIVYKPTETEILVVRVWHGAQNWQRDEN